MSNHTTRRLPRKSLEEKFWAYTVTGPYTDCWEWHGPTDGDEGYGRLYIARHKYIYAHRLSFKLYHGYLPDDLDILHTCDNPRCVSPYHLYAGTHIDNMADMNRKGRRAPIDNTGERNGQAKLTATDVVEIRRLHAEGQSRQTLAAQFDVRPGTISKIVLRQRWQHI